MKYLATILLLVLVLLCLQATSAAPHEESETLYIYDADAIVDVTTYYFIALFQYDNTVLNGAEDPFTTSREPRPPTVTTKNATNITTASATLNMTYGFMAHRSVQVQFKYKAEGASAWDETGWVSKTRSSSHSFSESIAGLSSGTTYYFTAQLKYDSAMLNGTENSFTTSSESRAPAVSTENATNIATASTTLNMAYDFMDYRSVQVQFKYKAEGASAWDETGWVAQSGSGTHSFSESIAGLSSGTTYYSVAQLKYDGTVLNGTEISFTTSSESRAPTVSTKNATNITTASATLNMTYDFMDYRSVHVQFRYKAEGVSEWNETGWVAQSGSGSYSFSESIAGLSSNTTYYFLALLKYDGTVLNGTEISFTTSGEPRPPTVTTENATNITTACATLNMAYDFRDYRSVHVQFRYKTEGARGWDETGWVAQSGSGLHSFSESLVDLSSNTTYYFMAQLKYDGTVLNGTEISFTTSSEQSPSTVTTENATNITSTSATLNMTYYFMDYRSVLVQFRYKAEGASAWNETGWVAQSCSGSHSFSEPILGLSSNKTYYFTAQLKYGGTVLNGTESSFTTSGEPRLPAVSTKNATNITAASTTLNMTYDFMDYSSVHVQFKYKAEGASAWNETGWVAQSGSGTHSFSESIVGLSSGTTYYFMAQLKYDSTVLNGTEIAFTTSGEPRPPTATTKNATNITTAYATLNMAYDFMDYSSVHVQFRYKADGASAWNETGWVSQTGSGSHSFSEPIASLSSNTTYHFLAMLLYDDTVLNGTENSFITSSESRAPTVSTKTATNITTAAATLNMTYDFMDYRSVHVQFRYNAEGVSEWNETGWVSQAGSGSHSFSEPIAGLSSNTTYYFMAQLKYDGTVLNGTENSFSTSVEPRVPAVSTKNATNITTTSATLNMTYDFMDYSSVLVQFRYKAEGVSGWNETGWVAQTGSGSYSFSESIVGLSSGTTYYFVAMLQYDGAVLNGTENTFTTSGELRAPTKTILIYNADAVIDITASTPPDDTLNSSDALPQDGVKTILIYNADAFIDLTASTPPDDALNSSDALPQDGVKKILIYNADAFIDLTASTPPDDALDSSDALPQDGVKTILIYNADAFIDLTASTPPDDALDSSDALPQDGVKTILIYNADATCDFNLDTASEHPPTANAGGHYSGNVNEDIQFYGSGTDPDGDAIVAYAWDFNNDEITDSTLRNPTHSWSSAGTYSPALKVQDETGMWSGWDWCEVNVYDLVPHLGPYPRSSNDKYYIRIFNIDDIGKAYVNDELVTSVSFGHDNVVDITGELHLGENEIYLTVKNLGEGYTWGFEIIHEDGTLSTCETIWEDSCGEVGVYGCNDNEQTGEKIVYEKKIILELEEWEFSDFSFVQVTDVHIGCITVLDPTCKEDTKRSIGWFTSVIDGINKLAPEVDFVLITGDLVEYGKPDFFYKFMDVLSSLDLSIRFYHIPGNHDRYTYSVLCGDDLTNYHDCVLINGPRQILIGPDNYTFEYGGYTFIGLDSGADLPLAPLYFWGTGLTEPQINGLMTFTNLEAPKIIFMHHPVFNDYSHGIRNWGIIKNNREPFITYCQDNNVQLVLTGHTHEDKIFNADGKRVGWDSNDRPLFIQTGSVKEHSECRVIEVNGYGDISIHPSTDQPICFKKSIWSDGSDKSVLHVYDSQGRHTGIDGSGNIVNEIPHSFYIGNYGPMNLEGIILYDDTEDYKLTVTLKDGLIVPKTNKLQQPENQSLNLTITSQTTEGLTTISFYNIPLTENTITTTSINQTATDYTMEIDTDGDGEIDGYKSSDSTETNYVPTATIISPENNSIFVHGDEITFNGTGTDPEEGVLTDLSLVWSSDIYGIIGTGNEFSTFNLSAGTHEITLMVNDSAGLSGLDSIEITVNAPDLTLNSSDISFAKPTEGEIIPINVTVHNIGFVNAANVTVHIFDGFPEFQISNLTVNSIPVGESRTVNATWNTTGKMGNHTISVMIDPDDLIEEMNETDNHASRFIVVEKNEPPIASFTYSPEKPVVNQTITFNASNSRDLDGIITKYDWEFGDGNITNTTEKVINHSYSLAGDYIVNLTVTDNDDATNISMARITVSSMPDLVITEKWLCWPDNCTICYNVTNIGSRTAPACYNTTLYVDGVEVAHDHVPVDLAPGESYTGCFNGYVWTYTPPSDNITVCADNNETLDEFDETNNCLTNIWMCGDVTGDGKVRTSDGRRIFRHITYGVPIDNLWAADVTGDGRVRTSDGRRIFRHITYGVPLNCKCSG